MMNPTIRIIAFAFITMFLNSAGTSQILHTESFTVILDTTQRIKGTIVPDLQWQNLQKDLLEFENLADLMIKFKYSAVTVANKFELSKFGGKTFVSGGYVYSEWIRLSEEKFSLELYNQFHWAEARGLDRKYAVGLNMRWSLIEKSNLGLYVGTGPFYEYEKWNYDGVRDEEELPIDLSPIETSYNKLGSYVSLKFNVRTKIDIDLSAYHQARLDEFIQSTRLASSSRISYNFSEYVGFSIIYQNIYDDRPVVPIEKLYHKVISGLSLNF